MEEVLPVYELKRLVENLKIQNISFVHIDSFPNFVPCRGQHIIAYNNYHYVLFLSLQHYHVLFNPLGSQDQSSLPFMNWAHFPVIHWKHIAVQRAHSQTCGYWVYLFLVYLLRNISEAIVNMQDIYCTFYMLLKIPDYNVVYHVSNYILRDCK